MDQKRLKNIIEGVLLAAGKTVTIDQMLSLFDDYERPERDTMKAAIAELQEDFTDRGVELKKVASGYRLQVRPSLSLWVSRLWEDKPPRYSRAFLETLALIAYRQPITRGEIEAVRGVAVSSNIIRSMVEREWVKVVGHRDVPGKPALYATTKEFLDSFNLNSLNELPTLAEIRSLEEINSEIDFDGKEDKHTDPGLHENPQTDLLNIPQDEHTASLLQMADSDLQDDVPEFANNIMLTTPVNVTIPDFPDDAALTQDEVVKKDSDNLDYIAPAVGVPGEPAFEN